MNPIEAFLQLIPEHSVLEFSISITLCIILALFAYWRKILDAGGSIASLVIGLVIAVFGNLYWLITLISFLLVTFIVTRLDFGYKKSHGVAQGKHGERNARNVMANGLIPALIPIFRPWLGDPMTGLLFIIAICEAASDSFANEIGVLSDKTYLITNLKRRVRPGTDGGVSILGEFAGFFGAVLPAIFGWLLISDYANNIVPLTNSAAIPMTATTLMIPIALGFLGCHIDSILGAVLQNRGLISNDNVNFLSVLMTVLIGFGVVTLVLI
jgi:uncharacterized protein (TIGR00297 family)